MADQKISDLNELTAPDAADELIVVDKSDTSMAATGTDKRIKVQTLAPMVVRKTADETVNNSAALQNDDHLVLPVLASSVYKFDLMLITNAASAAADWKFGWTYPSGTTIRWGTLANQVTTAFAYWAQATLATAAQPSAIETDTPALASGVVTALMKIEGIAIVGGTAGNLQFQWAQNTATVADSKVLTNSVLIAQKIG